MLVYREWTVTRQYTLTFTAVCPYCILDDIDPLLEVLTGVGTAGLNVGDASHSLPPFAVHHRISQQLSKLIWNNSVSKYNI